MNDFSIGRALGSSLKIWLRNFLPFMLLSALVYVPMAVVTYLFIQKIQTGSIDGIGTSFVMWVAGITLGHKLLSFVLASTLVYGVVMQLRGRPAPLGMCVSVGLARLLPVLGVSILVGLAVVGGLILLIIPGVIFACMLYVAVPVSVVERPGVFAALKRSAELTEGYRGSIFGMSILIFAATWLAGKVLENVLPATESVQAFLWANFVLQVVVSSFGAVVQGVVYHDLRLAKEGAQTEDLARVFD